MISSSDARCNEKKNVTMINKVKFMNKNVAVNNSDSGEEVEEGSCSLKVKGLTCLWNSIFNHVDTDCMCEQEHGEWNVVMMKRNRKILALINVHSIVNSESSRIKSYKFQHGRAMRSAKRSRQTRNTQLRELEENVKKCGASDVTMTGDFNESVCPENM